MDSFKEEEYVSWTNKKGDFTGKIIELKDYFAIIESEEKKLKFLIKF